MNVKKIIEKLERKKDNDVDANVTNWIVATINTTLQLLGVYRYIDWNYRVTLKLNH